LTIDHNFIETPQRKDSNNNLLFYQVTDAAGTIKVDSNGNALTTTDPSTQLKSVPVTVTIPAYKEIYSGNTPKPRIAIGIGFNWNSPFGPFRIDIAKALVHVDGDDTKTFTFNVGTQF
jgi:outer membrane protein insertion porin family